MPEKVFIGVDSGGTSTVALAVTASGRILGRFVGGPSNHYASDLGTARQNLKHTVASLLAKAGIRDYECIAIGLSALDYEPDQDFVASFVRDILPLEKTVMHSDVYMALMGLTLGEPGIIVVSGTGSMAMLLDREERLHVIGGWGYLLQDPGSSYAMAIQGIDAAIKNFEGLGPATRLQEAVLEHFAISQHRQLIELLYKQPGQTAGLAAFGKTVIGLARQGDAVAGKIVDTAIKALAAYACRLVEKMGDESCLVGMSGSVLEKNPDLAAAFQRQVQSFYPAVRLAFAEYEAGLGAALYAMKKSAGPASEKTLAMLKNAKKREEK